MLALSLYAGQQAEEEERKKRRLPLGAGWFCCCCCAIAGALAIVATLILSLIPIYLSYNAVPATSPQFYNIFSVTYGTNYRGSNSAKLANTNSLIPTLENAYSLKGEVSTIVSFQFSNAIGTSSTGRKKRLFDLKQCTKTSLLSGYQMNIKFQVLIPKRYTSDGSRKRFNTNIENSIRNNYNQLSLVAVFDDGTTASINMEFCAVEQISNSTYNDSDTTSTTLTTTTTTSTTTSTVTSTSTSTTTTTTAITTTTIITTAITTTMITTTALPPVSVYTCTFNVMHEYLSGSTPTADTTLYSATCYSFCSGGFNGYAPAAIAQSTPSGYTASVSTTAPVAAGTCVTDYGDVSANGHQFVISNTITSVPYSAPTFTPCDSPYGMFYCCCNPISG